jgi:hypothetical protein
MPTNQPVASGPGSFPAWRHPCSSEQDRCRFIIVLPSDNSVFSGGFRRNRTMRIVARTWPLAFAFFQCMKQLCDRLAKTYAGSHPHRYQPIPQHHRRKGLRVRRTSDRKQCCQVPEARDSKNAGRDHHQHLRRVRGRVLKSMHRTARDAQSWMRVPSTRAKALGGGVEAGFGNGSSTGNVSSSFTSDDLPTKTRSGPRSGK